MSTQPVPQRKNSDRIGGFARYFKQYMGASAIVTAALPVPAAELRLIPAYSSQRGYFGVYTSLFVFLILAFLYYSRAWIKRGLFVRDRQGRYSARPVFAICPLLFILGALACVFGYQSVLGDSVRLLSSTIGLPAKQALDGVASSDVPYGTTLMLLYLGIFLFAAAAFVMMSLREYLQDQLGISEQELLGVTQPNSPQ